MFTNLLSIFLRYNFHALLRLVFSIFSLLLIVSIFFLFLIIRFFLMLLFFMISFFFMYFIISIFLFICIIWIFNDFLFWIIFAIWTYAIFMYFQKIFFELFPERIGDRGFFINWNFSNSYRIPILRPIFIKNTIKPKILNNLLI